MSAPAGLFCEHKRLRTACTTCRPPPPPPVERPDGVKNARRPAAPKAEGEKPVPKAAAKPATEAELPRATGPGKPLMAKRKPRNKPVSRAEAEHAEAWWVQKK